MDVLTPSATFVAGRVGPFLLRGRRRPRHPRQAPAHDARGPASIVHGTAASGTGVRNPSGDLPRGLPLRRFSPDVFQGAKPWWTAL